MRKKRKTEGEKKVVLDERTNPRDTNGTSQKHVLSSVCVGLSFVCVCVVVGLFVCMCVCLCKNVYIYACLSMCVCFMTDKPLMKDRE